MPHFLHLADVHLGYDRYDNPQRTQDFFAALYDALERYALAPPVDFVLIAGDLFEHRNILPATLNQAQICLSLLKEAGIPVLAIEGNHDFCPYGTKTSWLRYLAGQGLLMLLEPNEQEGLDPWDHDHCIGGYIDLPCGVRVIGSRWYGSAAPQAVQQLATEIQQLPLSPGYTVMMFHHGLEGQIARYTGALRYEDLLPLKQAGVDYLALGHIHKNYSHEGWIFNPGSLEANSIAENRDQTPRGVYLVELNDGKIKAQLQGDYYQRSILRLALQADSRQTPQELEQAAIALVGQHRDQTPAAIVELKITGQVSFDRLDLDIRSLRQQLHQLSQALILLLKYEVTSTVYETILPESNGEEAPSRQAIEAQVFTDFLAANVSYQSRATQLARGLIDLKDQILNNQSEAELYEQVQRLILD